MSEHSTAQLLKSEDHLRGMQMEHAEVTSLYRPSPTLLRVSARLLSAGDDPNWKRPNVAFRILLDGEIGGLSRIYTVRSFNPATHEIVMDIVIHGSSSPMMRWAAGLSIGTRFALLGPRPHFPIPEAKGRQILLAADETALPALYSLLTTLPEDSHGLGWLYCRDQILHSELPVLPHLPIHWLPQTVEHRSLPASERPLAAAVLAAPHGENSVVWAAGEREEMKEIRNHFRRTLYRDKDDVAVFGYWKHGMDNTQIDAARIHALKRAHAEGQSMENIDDLALPLGSA